MFCAALLKSPDTPPDNLDPVYAPEVPEELELQGRAY
jgi:hypothetical protein